MNSPLTLKTLVKQASALPPRVHVLRQILVSLHAQTTSSAPLVNLIVQDQAFYVKLLRIANSPFYGMSGRIASIHDAVLLLGRESIGSMAQLLLSTALFEAKTPRQQELLNHYWRYSYTVALFSREIATHLRLPNWCDYFGAGLLHDLGLIVLLLAEEARYLSLVDGNDLRLYHSNHSAAESALFGFSHYDAGQEIAEQWHLPPPITEAIGGHHVAADQEKSPVNVVRLAIPLARKLLYGNIPGVDTEPDEALCRQLDAQAAAMGSWDEEIRHQLHFLMQLRDDS